MLRLLYDSITSRVSINFLYTSIIDLTPASSTGNVISCRKFSSRCAAKGKSSPESFNRHVSPSIHKSISEMTPDKIIRCARWEQIRGKFSRKELYPVEDAIVNAFHSTTDIHFELKKKRRKKYGITRKDNDDVICVSHCDKRLSANRWSVFAGTVLPLGAGSSSSLNR